MYTIYLKDEDLITRDQFPVIALINEAANSDIIEFTRTLVNGVGSGYDYSNCSFWNDLDDYDKANTPRFDGLWITNEANEEVIVPFKELLYYLEILYSRLSAKHFPRIDELRQLLDSFKARYC